MQNIYHTVETVICDFQWDFQKKVTYDRYLNEEKRVYV